MKSKGFTLIELLIYLAIVSVVLTSLVMFSISIAAARSKTFVAQEVQSNGRYALNLISQKIRTAGSIDNSQSVFNSHPGILTLNMSDPDDHPTVIQLNENNQITITSGGTSPIAITSNQVSVTNLTFTDLTGDSERANIGISLDIQYYNPGASSDYDYQDSWATAVSLRQ